MIAAFFALIALTVAPEPIKTTSEVPASSSAKTAAPMTPSLRIGEAQSPLIDLLVKIASRLPSEAEMRYLTQNFTSN
jgi:hypothetical protein